jgi:hypothetical protein
MDNQPAPQGRRYGVGADPKRSDNQTVQRAWIVQRRVAIVVAT